VNEPRARYLICLEAAEWGKRCDKLVAVTERPCSVCRVALVIETRNLPRVDVDGWQVICYDCARSTGEVFVHTGGVVGGKVYHSLDEAIAAAAAMIRRN
jgi:hypothetical protein